MIEIELKDEETAALLDGLARALTDLTPVMAELGELMVDRTRQRFQRGVAPDGTPWAPKRPATLERYRRARDRADPRPLFGPSERLSREILSFPGPDRLAVGSNLVYAAVQQFGAQKGAFGANRRDQPIPWGDIPARPFLGFAEEDRAAIRETVREWIEDAIEGR